ncbi:Peptide methionine sulfoxide reductase MsrA 3 [Streptomyces sp. RB17]|nr:Peptide methionine sulfoxide reductase MsrA 3 [Streptomyces sp. RB17]
MMETAVLAGGCFWGLQELFRALPGVVATGVGYTDGEVVHPTYRNHGSHVESVEITYDPSKTSYRSILEFFFQVHDPSTSNRHGDGVGTSYRSVIFYVGE